MAKFLRAPTEIGPVLHALKNIVLTKEDIGDQEHAAPSTLRT